MLRPQVERLVERILQALPRVGDLDSAIDTVREELETWMPGLSTQMAEDIAEARIVVAREYENIEILHTHSVIQRRTQWYYGPKPSDFHWPALRKYLLNEKKWEKNDIDVIDQASNEVVSLIEDPRSQEKKQFACRGLVVGYVQSGKTANMTAVISKALDAGYDTVIVLAGLTNKLRMQTQSRLYKDLVMRNPMHWQVLTPNEMDRDFRAPPQGGFLSHSDKAQLAVIKKNVSPLGELKLAIERTLPAVLNRLRVLVIDDECDQASVNAAQGELDTTAINQNIREILSTIPAVTYIGYTATPFANVLINPYRMDGQDLDDLYPRDFITALPKSENYFGTEKLFGINPADPEHPSQEEEGLDMIRDVPHEDELALQPESRQNRDSFQPNMTQTLESAILYFLACCSARFARGDSDKHMTMLVHTSAYTIAHERVAALIQGWVDVNRDQLRHRDSELTEQLLDFWNKEQDKLPESITEADKVDSEGILKHLPEVLERLEFPVENGASDDRINYTDDVPRIYIVVGGSILARGLTLEGLMVSYFLRTANQYDTLLQMGRWFGYRPLYEDLPRIWMPEDLKLRFRSLAAVEQEIRDDIEQYRLRDLTPMDIAVRVRAIPGMAITAATKMRAARRSAISYWGTHRQTFRFSHLNLEVQKANWAAGAELVTRAESLGLRDETISDRKIWRGVPKSSIKRFFETYKIEATHADLLPDMLIPFLESGDTRLDVWNLGIIEPGRGAPSDEPLGVVGTVRTVRRARLKDAGPIADIKALMSRRDLLFDCDDSVNDDGKWEKLKENRQKYLGQVPLLLLYPIDKTSSPDGHSEVRVPLDAVHDVLGIGLVLPGSVTEGGNYVSVELQTISAEEIAEIEAEESAQVEAAGVY